MAKGGLSDAEVAFFHENGFVVPAFRLPPNETARLEADVLRVVDDNPHMRNKPITTAHVASEEPLRSSGELFDFCRMPEILDMIEQIEGPDLILWTTSLFHKPAVDGFPTLWHQDGEYWPIQPLACTSVWVAATPSRRENGCLQVVRGSHRQALPHYDSSGEGLHFSRAVRDEEIDPNDIVDVELEPGQMVLMHAMVLHGARANVSDKSRTGFVMRFMSGGSYFDHQGGVAIPGRKPPYSDRPLFLVRGADRTGRNDLKRNHPTVGA